MSWYDRFVSILYLLATAALFVVIVLLFHEVNPLATGILALTALFIIWRWIDTERYLTKQRRMRQAHSTKWD